MTSGTRIVVEGVWKAYREGNQVHEVFRNASATIASGEFVALLGPSGSGKSTLLNLISAIDSPDSGRVLVGDLEVSDLAEPQRTLFRRSGVGLIFQFFNLLPTLTVEENVLLPLELTGSLTLGRQDRARDLLDRVGLSARRGSYPDRLSGGEQQRVAVIRAMVHEPGVVLADEPTGNLDEHAGGVVMDLLTELVRESGSTLLMVTHSLELAEGADRILRLSKGELAEDVD